MRSRTSCEVAEEAKENWLPHMVENSSEVSSEMELVTEVGPVCGYISFVDFWGCPLSER